MLVFIDIFCKEWFSLIFGKITSHRKYQSDSEHLVKEVGIMSAEVVPFLCDFF